MPRNDLKKEGYQGRKDLKEGRKAIDTKEGYQMKDGCQGRKNIKEGRPSKKEERNEVKDIEKSRRNI